MVTVYNRTIQGFLVHAVDHILRLDWGQLKSPPTKEPGMVLFADDASVARKMNCSGACPDGCEVSQCK